VRITELVAKLESIRHVHGDLDVHLVDPFARWRLPPLGGVHYTTDLVPGSPMVGGERSLVRFGEVRVGSDFAPQWRRHVRDAGFFDAVVLTEEVPNGGL
jgi:hypothetical protein